MRSKDRYIAKQCVKDTIARLSRCLLSCESSKNQSELHLAHMVKLKNKIRVLNELVVELSPTPKDRSHA